ncbi:glycerophosphodiester phosphodiesterase [Microcoleus sp. FACHB-672]|uniref:glycerophosphodiester phosphodiesterase n=1 Tax=Microcoleus sp. FACHB-672 TaxID=2692825 RepID=UPI0016852FC2|nr:glycerophosphodiester phosphodiesterase family protein [Microcoleus sp. FACHB-672]MBD2039570.1 glycerophosphodiester phosphodiesterase [Microcoleus sp. FACHB-672]
MEIEIIAHRGFSAIAPENTLAAFSAAIQHGADSIEFDIQLSADGVSVVIHDATLDRTTGTAGTVTEKTLEQLKALDAGSWFSEEYAGERIPTLKEVLIAIKSIKKFIYLDVKKHCEWSNSAISDFVKLVVNEGWADRCIISSFNEVFVDKVRSLCSNVKLGYIVADAQLYQSQLEKAASAGNTVMISAYDVLLSNPSLIQASKDRGIDIIAWTVDNPNNLKKLIELGVTRIVTNSLVAKSKV